jgi:CBS domain containing-hemolysin-like protein
MDWVILGSYVGAALFVSATCSLLEAVLLGVNVMKLKADGGAGSKRMLEVKEKTEEASSAILSLNTVAHTIGASLAGAQAAHMFGDAWVGVFSGILTLLILVLTEIIPKNYGNRNSASLAGPSAWVLQKIVIPIMKPVAVPSNWLIRLLFGEEEDDLTSEAEVIETIKESRRDSVLKPELETRLLRGLKLKDQSLGDFCTPLAEMAVGATMTLGELAQTGDHSEHTRILVQGEEKGDIRGYVYLQEAFRSILLGKNQMETSLGQAAAFVEGGGGPHPKRAACSSGRLTRGPSQDPGDRADRRSSR